MNMQLNMQYHRMVIIYNNKSSCSLNSRVQHSTRNTMVMGKQELIKNVYFQWKASRFG